ncbi:MAG: 2-phospho-L-lactate transferase [Rubrivivax sp.]|nr:2-phospho-L-lactate transferase [Rubrivivax sp.]
MRRTGRVLAISGGVGGAKLALGLARVLPPEALDIVVNTGDDFRHLGLAISPDLDSVLYALAGLADGERGWGRAGETWQFMAALRALGGEDWFALGDLDLATHVERTRRLAAGETLTQATAALAQALGVQVRLLPMSDDPVATVVDTDEGRLAFQHYFVRRRCEPRLTGLHFEGAQHARPAPELLALGQDASLRAVVLCPSNPWLSVDPLLALPGVRAALAACPAPVVAVSPLVAGKAVKGPTAKLMAELGLQVSHRSIAQHYAGLVDVLLVDADEPGLAMPGGPRIVVVPTLMNTLDDRERLAQAVLEAAS